jgi:glyoxylase-like metal-dependent hydrolase (beta-lactamase superfamily II)
MTTLTHPWTTPPEPGETIAVAPGIKWLRMPLPFALNHINLWLLEDDGGWAIVDTGVGLPPTREAWERIFATQLEGKPVSRVIATHFHPDHMGNAGWLVDRWGVDFWCTQAEFLSAHLACRQRDPADMEKRLTHYRHHGFGEAALDDFRKRGNHYPHLVPTFAEQYRCLREGDVLAVGSRKWEILTVYGHAPEHACLLSREDAVLIAGDQVLPKITTNVSVWPEQPLGNPLRLYLDSLHRFRPMAPETLVLPSHGLPFHGLHARLDMLRAHHDDRLAETVDALGEPRTGVELIPVLFRRQLDVHQLSFAIGEVLAHLHLLEADGAVTRVTGPDRVHRFRKL